MEYPKIETLFNRDAKTHEVMEDQIRLPEFSNVKNWWVTEKIDGCLHYSQTIHTDEGLIEIGRLVNGRLPVKVVAYNELTGKIEYEEILNYHKEPLVRPFVCVTVQSRNKGNRPKHIVCTDNHRFYVAGVWKRASELRVGDTVSHMACGISEETRQVVLGTLLGDASIYRPSPTTRGFSFNQVNHKYFEFKRGLLGNVFHEGKGAIVGFKNSLPNRRGSSIITPKLSDLILDYCEVKGKKHVTPQWVKELSPLAIAVWYMDDGSCNFTEQQRPRARIATNRYTWAEAKRLAVALNDRFNLNCTVFNYKGPTLVFTADGTDKLFSLIYPFVPACMKYKLPRRYASARCTLTPEMMGSQKLDLVDTKVLNVTTDLPTRAKGQQQYQYDLTIKRHSNYFTNGILVHNTNIRVAYTKEQSAKTEEIKDNAYAPRIVEIKGRTDSADMPKFLLQHLGETFTAEKFATVFPNLKDDDVVALYGEGYGLKINSGGNYRAEGTSFRLFDVRVGTWWLEPQAIGDIASKMGIKTVPEIGVMTLEDAVKLVKSKPKSRVTAEENPGRDNVFIEGIVARSYPLMLRRNGERVIWKLKVKDFAQ